MRRLSLLAGSVVLCVLTLQVGCSLALLFPPETAPLRVTVSTERFQLSPALGTNYQTTLTAITNGGQTPYFYEWSVRDPSGDLANELLDALDGPRVTFSAGPLDGPYVVYCTVIDSAWGADTARSVLQVGTKVALELAVDRAGVTAGGGARGSTTLRLTPMAGTPPYDIVWTVTGPDRTIDNDRLDVTDPFAPVFVSGTQVGTYVLTAEITDVNMTQAVESAVVTVGQSLGLDVTASRTSVLPGGGLDGRATLTATPIGGNQPYTYEWEVLGPDGRQHNYLLWDREVRTPEFESNSLSGTYVVRCAVTDADGIVLLGSANIVVGQDISVDIVANRLTLPIAGSEAYTGLLADIRGGRDPLEIHWEVITPTGVNDPLRLNATDREQARFTPSAEEGPYIVRCTVTDADGVTDSDAVVLIAGGLTGATVSAEKTSLMPGGSDPTGTTALRMEVHGGVPPITYAWSVIDPSGAADPARLDDATIQTPEFASTTTLGTYTVVCVATDADGMQVIGCVHVNVGQPLNVDVSVDRQALAGGGGVSGQSQIITTITGGAPPYDFVWDVGNPSGVSALDRLNDSTIANPVFTSDLTTGTYRLTLRTTDSLGVVFVDSVELVVSSTGGGAAGQELALDVSINRRPVPPGGQTAILSATVTGGVAPLTYAWTLTEPSGATNNSLLDSTSTATVTFTSPATLGTYRARCVLTDAVGSQFIDSIQFNVSDSFVLDVTAATTDLAPGGTVNLFADHTGGEANFTYTWTCVNDSGNPAGSFSTGSTGVGAATQVATGDVTNAWTAPPAGSGSLGTYRIVVQLVDAMGSVSVDSTQIIVGRSLSLNLSANDTFVAPSTLITLLADQSGGETPFTYTWLAENSAGVASGTFTTGAGSTGTASQTGQAADATNAWSVATPGTYTITCTVTDDAGQSVTDSISVVVTTQQSFTLDVTANQTYVTPSTVLNLVADQTGGKANFTYVWTAVDLSGAAAGTLGSAVQSGLAGDATNTWTASATEGTYRITCVITDAVGRTTTDSIAIIVTKQQSFTLNVTADRQFVAPSTVLNLAADQTGGTATFSYAWTAVNEAGAAAGTLGAALQSGLPGDAANTWTASATEGTYRITCIVTDAVGRTSTDTTTVIVTRQQSFTLDVTADQLFLAPGDIIVLTADQTGGTANFSYAWSAIDESGAAAGTLGAALQTGLPGDATNTWTAPTADGTYRITCIVTDAIGRTTSDTVQVAVGSTILQNYFPAPAAADDEGVLAASFFTGPASGGAPGQVITTGLTSPSEPRTARIVVTDTDDSVAWGFARITGLNARGLTQVETIAIGASSGGGSTTVGAVPFATITKVEFYGFAGITYFPPVSADKISVGRSDKFGLTGTLVTASDVLYVNEGGTILTSGYTVDVTANQQGVTFASPPDGARNYIVVFRSY